MLVLASNAVAEARGENGPRKRSRRTDKRDGTAGWRTDVLGIVGDHRGHLTLQRSNSACPNLFFARRRGRRATLQRNCRARFSSRAKCRFQFLRDGDRDAGYAGAP